MTFGLSCHPAWSSSLSSTWKAQWLPKLSLSYWPTCLSRGSAAAHHQSVSAFPLVSRSFFCLRYLGIAALSCSRIALLDFLLSRRTLDSVKIAAPESMRPSLNKKQSFRIERYFGNHTDTRLRNRYENVIAVGSTSGGSANPTLMACGTRTLETVRWGASGNDNRAAIVPENWAQPDSWHAEESIRSVE